MAPAADILRYVSEVAEQFAPQQIVLFGSHAYGRPTPDSDVDLLVVMPHRGAAHHAAARIRQKVPAPFALDLLVRDAREIARRIGWNDFFLDEITKKGIVLYAANDSRVGEQGRRRLRRRLAAAPVAQAVAVRPDLLSRPAVRREVPQGPASPKPA